MLKQLGDAALVMVSVRFQSLIGGGVGVEFVTAGIAPAELPGKPLDDTELSIIHLRVAPYLLIPNTIFGNRETTDPLALHIPHYETTNLSHLSMGQIELRRRIGAISDLRGNLLAVNLHRHAWRIHHKFLGPPLPRHLRVGAATGLGRFPREGPGLWATTFPKPRARCLACTGTMRKCLPTRYSTAIGTRARPFGPSLCPSPA